MARGRQHDDQTRAAAMAALLAGQSVDQVAEQFDLPRSTVHSWSRHADEVRPKKDAAEFGDLVADYLRATLRSLQAQVVVFGDPEWLKTQPAHELAVLHGVQADKAFRLLSALEPVTHRADDDDGSPPGPEADPA